MSPKRTASVCGRAARVKEAVGREIVAAATIDSTGSLGGHFPFPAGATTEVRQQLLKGPYVMSGARRLEVSLLLVEVCRRQRLSRRYPTFGRQFPANRQALSVCT